MRSGGEWSDAHSEDDSRVSGSGVIATATNMNVSMQSVKQCARGSLLRWVVVKMRGPARRMMGPAEGQDEMAGGNATHT